MTFFNKSSDPEIAGFEDWREGGTLAGKRLGKENWHIGYCYRLEQ